MGVNIQKLANLRSTILSPKQLELVSNQILFSFVPNFYINSWSISLIRNKYLDDWYNIKTIWVDFLTDKYMLEACRTKWYYNMKRKSHIQYLNLKKLDIEGPQYHIYQKNYHLYKTPHWASFWYVKPVPNFIFNWDTWMYTTQNSNGKISHSELIWHTGELWKILQDGDLIIIK